GYVLPGRRASVKLTWAADFLGWVLDHFAPLRDPADRSRKCEEDGEHLRREPKRAQRNARVEVDVRVELLSEEILIAECDPLKLEGDFQKLIIAVADLLEDLVAGLAHDLRARVVVLVDPVAEAHQAEAVVGIFGAGNVFGDPVNRADLLEHRERRFVRAAV